MNFSIIIPTLNEEENIARCLKSIIAKYGPANGDLFETIIVDGASKDKTIKIAEELVLGSTLCQSMKKNFKIIRSNFCGLALQLNEGAHHSIGEVLIFFHADSMLPQEVFEKINDLFSRNLSNKRPYVGGAFSLLFEGKGFLNKINSFFGNLYGRISKIYFGDRVIFVKRDVFFKLNGFKNIPIMADVDFSIRMKNSGRTAMLKGPVLTSPRGITGDRLWRRAYLIIWALYAYRRGIDPRIIKIKYYRNYSRENDS